MSRIARDPRGAALVGSAAHRARPAHRPHRPDPQRGPLAGRRLGRRRLAGRRSSTAARRARPPDRRRRRRRRSWSSRHGCCATGSSSAARSRARPSRTPSASPASTSSPGTTRRPCRATWPSARRASSRCGSRASCTTSSTSCSCRACRSRSSASSALPWQWRGAALRPLVVVSAMTFLVTTLFFPVATTWGTFLHAAGPIQVLIVLSALLALDAGIARLGARLGWTRPVAWLGPLLGVFGSILFSVDDPADLRAPGLARAPSSTRSWVAAWPWPASPSTRRAGPIIANFPIWLAWAERVGLAGPARRDPGGRARPRGRVPRHPPARRHRRGPRRLAGHPRHERPGTECYTPVDLGPPAAGATDDPLGGRARVRHGLPMNDDPYTRTSMDAARARTEARDTDLAVSSEGADVQARIVQAQEAERLRLAQEIHDGPAQALLERHLPGGVHRAGRRDGRPLARTELRYLRDLLRRELGDVRSFISQLRPPVLDELGLDGAIQDTVDLIRSITGARSQPNSPPRTTPSRDAERTVVLRIGTGSPAECPKTRPGQDRVRDDMSGTTADGSWKSATTAGNSISEMRRPRGRRNFGLQFIRERAGA